MERLLADASKIAIEQGLVDESALKAAGSSDELAKAEKALATAQNKVASAQDSVYKKQQALSKAQITYNEAVKKSGASSA